ncbi:uncharacterized protein [Pyrus communis]|uniref:uncharacterized protein n=1 Tax=Pyrus communis TaxID=23211 RepID=UPI0035C1F0A5
MGVLELLSQHVREIVDSRGQIVHQNGNRQSIEGEVQVRWVKPPFCTIKVNCDGAWCKQTSVEGCGWVAMDFVGIFKAVGCMGNIRCGSSLMAEAETLRLALMACVELGFGVLQFETDLKVLVDMINGVLASEAALEGILWDMNLTRQQLSSVEFLFTPRACNGAAHQVASYVTRVGDFHLWDRFEPEWLFNTLAFDVNMSIHL